MTAIHHRPNGSGNVRRRHNKWQAQSPGRKGKYLGLYETRVEAERAILDYMDRLEREAANGSAA
jgi:hypothetical protein